LLLYLERVRFFPRQLITHEDLIQLQEYFRNKMHRHNRLLHGWGVVCGAKVHQTGSYQITIEPAYVLGPYGDEIVIENEVHLDIRSPQPYHPAGIDPWCKNIGPDCKEDRPICDEDHPLYVAVRFVECLARPVKVHKAVSGCDELACEYSRIRDSYEIKLLRGLPESYRHMPQSKSLDLSKRSFKNSFCNESCPLCPSDPWVVLATIQCSDGRISLKTEHRRHIASFASYSFTCE
jgi:hypothetical protein